MSLLHFSLLYFLNRHSHYPTQFFLKLLFSVESIITWFILTVNIADHTIKTQCLQKFTDRATMLELHFTLGYKRSNSKTKKSSTGPLNKKSCVCFTPYKMIIITKQKYKDEEENLQILWYCFGDSGEIKLVTRTKLIMLVVTCKQHFLNYPSWCGRNLDLTWLLYNLSLKAEFCCCG